MATPSAEAIASTYRSFIAAVNEHKLDSVDQYIAYPVIHNGKSFSRDEHLAHLQNMISKATNALTEIDILVVNRHATAGSRPVAASRLINTLAPGEGAAQLYGLDPALGRKRVRIANHFLIWFTESPQPKIAELSNIVDTVAIGEQLKHPDWPLPDVSRASFFDKVDIPAGTFDLAKKIKEWYSYSEEGTLAAHAADYLHDNVTVRGQPITRDALVAFIEQGLEALAAPGEMKVEVKTLVVDNEKQQVSSRFAASVKLVKPFAGIEPNGKAAVYEEHVFYQFDQGRISAMDTIVDFVGLRRQMYGNKS